MLIHGCRALCQTVDEQRVNDRAAAERAREADIARIEAERAALAAKMAEVFSIMFLSVRVSG